MLQAAILYGVSKMVLELRATIFLGLLIAGTLFLENLALLSRPEAYLVAGISAAALLFFVPDKSRKGRNLKEPVFGLVMTIGTYLIIFKLRAWLTLEIGQPLSVFLTLLLAFLLGAGLLTVIVLWGNKAGTNNAE